MKPSFRSEIDARLSDLTFTGQAQVLERIHARRPAWVMLPKRTVALLLALMLMLCGTAVALTLRYSARFDLMRQARGALGAAYGLTGDMIDLFAARLEQDDDGWTVRFSPVGWSEQMGEYTVTGKPDGSVTASWSHDGADDDAVVWRAEQLQQFMDVRKAQQSAFNQTYDKNLTLEERAAIDAPLLELPGAGAIINILPGAEDLSPEEAERLARQAVMDKYGLSEATLSGYRTDLHFYLMTEDGSRQYDISLEGEKDSFRLYINSPAGDIPYFRWLVNPEDVRLPEGNLADYPEAVEEYVQVGAFDVLSPEEKAAVYQQFEAAGLSDLLPEGVYVTPAAADLNEQAAIARAKEAMEQFYGFPEEAFELFGVRTAMLRREEGRVWQIQFTGQYHPRYTWLSEASLGVYTVSVSADGAVADCAWSLAEQSQGAFTEEYIGVAEVYDGPCLVHVMRLLPKLDAVLSKYPDYPDYIYEDDLSIEDHAAFDGLMRQAGFNPRQYASVMPRANDMTQQEALDLAREVLKSEFGVTDKALDSSRLEICFQLRYDMGDEPIRCWDFTYKGREVYWVVIDAEEGVIMSVGHDDLTTSNG